MPIQSVRFRPGVNVEETYLLNEAGWSQSNLIRFKNGLPQPIGGWEQLIPSQLTGTPRALWTWRDLNSNQWVAIGTTQKLYAYGLGVLYDITPSSTTINFIPQFAEPFNQTVNVPAWRGNPAPFVTGIQGSGTTATFFTNYHSFYVGETITLNIPVGLNGIVLSGDYTIQTADAAAGTFTITTPNQPGDPTGNPNKNWLPGYSTTMGSTYIVVTLPGNSVSVGSTWNVYPISVGGITLSGNYTVDDINIFNDPANFEIAGSSPAVFTDGQYPNNYNLQIVFHNPASASGYGFSVTSGSTACTVYAPYGGGVTNGQTVVLNTQIQVSDSGGNALVPGGIPAGAYTVSDVSNGTGWSRFTIQMPVAATGSGIFNSLVKYTTTAGNTTVTCLFPAHGLSVGDSFTDAVGTSVGGLTIKGNYTVQSVIDANTFTIVSVGPASEDATNEMNGDEAQLVFQGASGGATLTATNWSLANWGSLLLACTADGAIYSFDPANPNAGASYVPNSPSTNGGIFIAMPEQILVAWGSSIGGVQNPLLVQWSNIDDFTNWTPTVTDQAGNFVIPSGSRIMGAVQAPQQALIWTDVDVWSMNYLGGQGSLGAQLVFGFNKLAEGCGLIAQHAACTLFDQVYWMSQDQFLTLSGTGVVPIPCTVWDEVFQDLDTANAYKICAAPNSKFNEIAWYYPSLSGGTGENDSYVKYNVIENVWDYGKLPRSAWIDVSIIGNPVGADPSGFVYQHEIGTTANGSPLNWSITSGAFMLNEGDHMMFVDWMLPDFKYGFANGAQDATVNVTVNTYDFPPDSPVVNGPYTVTATSPQFVPMRARGRAMTIGITGTGFARLGNLRYRAAPDGKY